MPTAQHIPEIAIIGHPNEGKSSVLSTLAEDDTVRISPIPGETTECRIFPVSIDGRELLRFTDTPGFQNPEQVLHELRMLADKVANPVAEFRRKFAAHADLRDDIGLLTPVERGAAIIYVVDGSRPLRNVDRAEMEILRLTGRPRMAIINCKDDSLEYLESWKNEFRKNFNAVRVFNAHRATYAERILLLDALKSIDQDWQQLFSEVVTAFRNDWDNRLSSSVDIMLDMLEACLGYRLIAAKTNASDEARLQREMKDRYCWDVIQLEQQAHKKLRNLFRHTAFNYALPTQSILHEDLFSETTWNLLGLSRQQLAMVGAIGGAALAAGFDLLAGGTSLGLFTMIGGAVGALGAYLGGEQMLKEVKIMGFSLGEEQIQTGPNTNLTMLFVLVNRALLYFQQTINWAHGRRDYEQAAISHEGNHLAGFTQKWPAASLRSCKAYFTAITEDKESELAQLRQEMREILSKALHSISNSE